MHDKTKRNPGVGTQKREKDQHSGSGIEKSTLIEQKIEARPSKD